MTDTTGYTTKREKLGAALQVCRVGGFRYLRIVRVSDGKIAALWNHAPFTGRLTDAYAAFDKAMSNPMPEGEALNENELDFVANLPRMLERTGPTSYGLRS